VSLSIANGRVNLGAVSQSVGSEVTTSINIMGINEANTQADPITVSLTASIP